MPKFQRCDESVTDIAADLINLYHEELAARKVKIDYVFAFAERDEVTLEVTGNALTKNGCKALGIARKISLKDRALGRGDAEIAIDGDWWQDADEAERSALLDHELHHLIATEKRDDIGRPIIKLRPHDYEFGWFRVVAARHGSASQERKQARTMMEDSGQYFWGDLTAATATAASSSRMQSLEVANA